jgi:hypothetical protein
MSRVARKAGYERIQDGATQDIFGNTALNFVYRKIHE